MTDQTKENSPSQRNLGGPKKSNQTLSKRLTKKAKSNPLFALGGVVAALMVPTVTYLGYDLIQDELSPCQSIFQQTAVNLSTKIRFLKTEGEVQLGRSQLTDLNERAQMTALNLKTCCTVLDSGKLDPEQFLQCKEKTRAYDDRIDDLVRLVQASLTTGAVKNATVVNASAAASDNARPVDENLKAQINKKVEDARQISKQFNNQVVQVRKEQALQRLEAVAPKNVDIAGQEREPNNDVLNTNVIELDKWVTASIGEPKDADFFFFETPDIYRDWLKIEIQNRSTTLEPRIIVYNEQKADAGGTFNKTAGADLTHSFVIGPKSKFYVRVSNYYGNSTGVYLLRVSPQKAYDKFEPNQDILSAKKTSVAEDIEAAIMDNHDVDYFVFENKGDKAKITMKLENRSRSLHPRLTLYNGDKVHIGDHHSKTAGANINYTFDAEADGKYYVAVDDYYQGGSGDYTLSIEKQ